MTVFYTPPKERRGLEARIWKAEQKTNDEGRRKKSGMTSVPGAEKGIFEQYGRMEQKNLIEALGPVEERKGVVAYVCGPPEMTDWAVQELADAEGVEKERVLCEKWW